MKIISCKVSFSTRDGGKIYAIQYGEDERAVFLARRITNYKIFEAKKSFFLDFSST